MVFSIAIESPDTFSLIVSVATQVTPGAPRRRQVSALTEPPVATVTMSLTHWSSAGERETACDSMDVAVWMVALAPSTDCDDHSSCTHTTEQNDVAVFFLIHALLLLECIVAPVEDTSIPWDADPRIAEDIPHSDALAMFRFRKEHVQETCDMLWPRDLSLP